MIGPAQNIGDARELARTNRIDVALLDVNLSDGEVIAPVLEALRARAVPVLIYTGAELPQRLRERHPELRVLQKPLVSARIVGELWKAARRDQPSSENRAPYRNIPASGLSGMIQMLSLWEGNACAGGAGTSVSGPKLAQGENPTNERR